jgi:hypothetical protein
MIMMMMVMGHEYERGMFWMVSMGEEGDRKGY